jgi:hypothetical protein
MDPLVALAETRLRVEPGGQARTLVTIRNTGATPERYTLQVLGQAAAWAEALPGEVTLPPGAATTVQLLFRPPRDGSVPPGELPFGLRCASRDRPDRGTVVEGDLTVGAVPDPGPQPAPGPGRRPWRSRLGSRTLLVAGVLAAVVGVVAWSAMGGGGIGPWSPGPRGSPAGTARNAPAADVQGFYVVYGAYPVDDVASQGEAQRRTAELQAAGIQAKLLDSRASRVLEDGLNGLWVVYWDGFASHEQAVAFCNQHRDRAPTCFAPR